MENVPALDLEPIRDLVEASRPGFSLPQGLYTDPAAYAFDLEVIFGKSWLLVGFEAELPKAGSYLALTIGTWPVLILRDRSCAIRAYHNTCRHRGAQICADGHGSAQRLVCPYHRWTYELTGELVHAGRMGPEFEMEDYALGAIHAESVGGVLYICFAKTPPPIETFRRQFEPLIAPHNLKDSKVAFESTLIEKGNWKLVMENARECYHCPGRHPELSASFPVEAGAYFDFGEDHHATSYFERMKTLGLGVGPVGEDWWEATRFPLNPGYLSMTMDGSPAVKRFMCSAGEGDLGSLRWAVEPHAFCHAYGDHVFMFAAFPTAPDETLVLSKWLVHKDAVEGVDYDLETLTTLWTRTNLQDRDLVENNQRGVKSPGYRPGPYSADAESLAIRFVNWYVDRARAYLNGGASVPEPRAAALPWSAL